MTSPDRRDGDGGAALGAETPSSPTPQQWREMQRVLDGALCLPPESRVAHVTDACATDAALRGNVMRLLNACARVERTEGFLASPAAAFGAPILADLASRDAERRSAFADELRTALAGRYTIERALRHGGMASVFLARDLRHDRAVAVKVLAPDLVAPSGVQRFLQEIRVTAGLNHPHVLPVHDSGEAGGLLYYVMPYVETETLRARLRQENALPLPDAIRLVRELADALAFAHAHGVVHCDLKPENVLLSGGHAVVADFGIARALAAVSQTGASPEPTGGSAALVLGTPAYMAPEQAVGGATVDHRADLYALGVLAYELFAGVHPFSSRFPEAPVAAHATAVPVPLGELRSDLPPALSALVMQCLASDPAGRPASAEHVLEVLDQALNDAVAPRRGTSRRAAVAGLAAAAFAGVALVAAISAVWSDRGGMGIEFGPVRWVTRDPGIEIQPALSPDGRFLAYAAGPVSGTRVYVRDMAGGAPIELAKDFGTGAQGQQFPAWSPDGKWILFWNDCALYRVPGTGGIPEEVKSAKGETCSAAALSAAAWSPSGEELAYLERDSLFVAPLAGGATRRLGVFPTGHSPAWSPDGRWIVLGSGNAEFAHGSYVLGGMAGNELILVPAAGGEPVSLTDRWNLHTSPVWLPDSRHIVFMSTQGGGRDVHVLRIDAAGHRVGAPERLTTGLDVATLAISADGKTLAYSAFDNASGIWSIDIPPAGVVTSSASARQVTWGTEHVEDVSVSPDGEWLAFDSDRAGNSDIYVMSLAGGEPRRITTDPGFDFVPSWSPDGKEIVYQSSRNGTRDVFVIGADGAGDRMVAAGPADESLPDWAPDGRRIVFHRVRPDNVSLFVSERAADGSWGDARQLSAQYGHVPRWSPDGQTILYKCRPRVPVPSGPARGLCRIAPDGSGQRHLLEPDQFPGGPHRVLSAAWAPDGHTIYVSAGNDSSQQSVWTLPAAGGTPRLIVRLDDPDRPPGRGAFDTDGKRLYFTFARRHSDIKTMEIRRAR